MFIVKLRLKYRQVPAETVRFLSTEKSLLQREVRTAETADAAEMLCCRAAKASIP